MNIAAKITAMVFVSVLIPLILFGQMSYGGIDNLGSATHKMVINQTSNYLAEAAKEAVKMKARDVAAEIGTYLNYNDENITLSDLISDSEFLMKAMQPWADEESTWVVAVTLMKGETKVVLVAKPDIDRSDWGKDLKSNLRWDKKEPDLYRILTRSLDNPDSPLPVCGYYLTGKEFRETGYACFYPTGVQIYNSELKTKMHLLAGTMVKIDDYVNYITKNVDKDNDNLNFYIDWMKGQISKSLGLAVILGAVLAGFTGYFTLRNVSKPIIEISRAADRISSGQLDVQIPHQLREDEVGRLAKSVERLRRSLNRAVESLEEILK
jgi:HAMP domain-containing protein